MSVSQQLNQIQLFWFIAVTVIMFLGLVIHLSGYSCVPTLSTGLQALDCLYCTGHSFCMRCQVN